MQVIKPFPVNDANMTSTIAEPDLTQGEAEWVQDRPNFFSSIDNLIFGVTVVNDVIYVLAGVDAVNRNVQSYEMDGTPIATFTPLSNTLMSITTDGTDLLLCKNASATSISVYKYSTAGAYIETKTFTFSQSATENDRAICFANDMFYAHSYTNGVHSTITAFNYSESTRVAEFNVDFIFYNPALGLTYDGTDFYLLNSTSELHRIKSDFSESSLAFLARVNGKFAVGAFYIDEKFWFASNSILTPQDIGFQFINGFGFGAYNTGEQAIKTTTHKLYQAVTINTDDPETGVDLAVPSWVEVSATNKYRAFDFVTNLQTVGPSPLVITLTPNTLFSALAVFNVTGATSVNVTVNDPTDGEVYNKDIEMIDISGIVNMWQYYFYEHVSYITRFAVDDLPPYKAATITVTFTGGDISVGELVYGKSRIIGKTTLGTSTDRKSYSKITIDSFGNQSRTKAPSADYTSYEVDTSTSLAQYVESTLKDVIDEPALFIGDDVDDKDIITLGYFERSPLVRARTRSKINLKVRGLT